MSLFFQGQLCLVLAYFFPDIQVGMLITASIAFLVHFVIDYQLMLIERALDMIKNNWDGYLRLKKWGYWD